MTPEEKRLLLKTHELAEENNEILKKLQRMYRVGRAVKVTYWVVIIAISLGAYYLVQPYVDSVRDIYSGIREDIANIRGLGDNSTE